MMIMQIQLALENLAKKKLRDSELFNFLKQINLS